MDPDPACYENLAIDEGAVRKIILDYLIHNCLQETAEAFVACTGMKYSFDWSAKLDKRKNLLQNNEDVLFDLLTLHFVELVRSRNCTGALEFAQKELTSYGNREQYIEKLQDVVTLLAYEEPEKSPVYEFLSMDHRQSVADKLNKLVLTHHQLPATSSLERLVQQVSVVRYCLKQDCGKDGWAPFSLTSFLKR
ncbi:hypothetical protein KP509_01G026100 [Ceratopteris richardii]|uniref:CTLH domain-containing protein n=1 Tax=Ceratopteris richardii TaxID=49495 RepID=A0A8T2VF56_CERRI|nr:hypothetical protein KP509_01G026100 [Ceratopteris richardii]